MPSHAGVTFKNFTRFLKDYGTTLHQMRSTHSLRQCIRADPIPDRKVTLCSYMQHSHSSQIGVLLSQLKDWVSTSSTKLEKLFKHYGNVRSKHSFGFVQCHGSGALLSPSEFLLLVKECCLIDSNISRHFCLQVAMMAQQTQIDRYTCDGEYAESLPVPDSKISDLFSISFAMFQRILGALAVAKDQSNTTLLTQDNHLDHHVKSVYIALVSDLLLKCPSRNELRLY